MDGKKIKMYTEENAYEDRSQLFFFFFFFFEVRQITFDKISGLV